MQIKGTSVGSSPLPPAGLQNIFNAGPIPPFKLQNVTEESVKWWSYESHQSARGTKRAAEESERKAARCVSR